jgi:NAD(P)-dependent dehydrogenase (short-subunit alcohol dehydrogenase family)
VGGARRERGRALRGDRLGARARRLTVQVGQAKARGISEERVLEDVILEPHAVKRLIEPDEVADVVAFLAGPGGGAFSGAAVPMDLGWTAR